MTTMIDAARLHGGGRLRPVEAMVPAIAAVLQAVRAWRERARQRRELLMLSDAELKDIGINRCDACGEGWKPFWQA